MCSIDQESNGSNDVVMVVMVVINWISACVQALTGADAPTLPDSEDELDLRRFSLHPATPRGDDQAVMPTPRGRRRQILSLTRT